MIILTVNSVQYLAHTVDIAQDFIYVGFINGDIGNVTCLM